MNGREKGKISIRTALQQRDATLNHRLETIWAAIVREIQEQQKSKEGHQQWPLHCRMVEDNLGKLIPDDQKSDIIARCTPPEADIERDSGKSGIIISHRECLFINTAYYQICPEAFKPVHR